MKNSAVSKTIQNKKYVAPDGVRGLRICRVMGKTLIIAEKPSVASDISKALGKFQKHEDYFENDQFVISSAVGHLLTIVPPPGVEAAKGKWTFKHLPVIPPHFDLEPIERRRKPPARPQKTHQAR